MDEKLVLLSVFTYRWRGEVCDTPILFTDFDPKNLRMFVIQPPRIGPAGKTMAWLEAWDELSKWSITERPMTDDEFSEINALCANWDLETNEPKRDAAVMYPHPEGKPRTRWLEPVGYKRHVSGDGYSVHGYIARPRSSDLRKWVVSLNVVETKLAKGEPLE